MAKTQLVSRWRHRVRSDDFRRSISKPLLGRVNGEGEEGREQVQEKAHRTIAHKGKQRANNPPVGLVTQATDKESGKKTYAHDPHLDPQLVWAGKAERTSFGVPTVSLQVHERIDPRTIVEAVRRRNGSNDQQMSLFQSPGENPPLRQAIEFYKHPHNWSNRLIAGDSLLVMNSLLEKEGMAGQVPIISFQYC
jgi:adenine-specific DNA-methyltransferase